MDLRLLQYFATAAELEHIGKAAERLHISQSPLSRQIRQLEIELGLDLFVRERQRVRLTESGRWLLEESRKLLAHAGTIRSEAAVRAKGKSGTLSVGFVSSAMWGGLLPRLLRRFQAECPDATLELRNMRSPAQVEAVEKGILDLAFVNIPVPSSHVEVRLIAEEPYSLVVPGKDRLARKRAIGADDLETARWIVYSRSVSPRAHARLLAVCAAAGFTPNIVQEVTEPNTMLALIESGVGIGLLEGSARNWAPKSIRFRSVPWLELKARTFMIVPVRGKQPLANRFASYVPGIAGSAAIVSSQGASTVAPAPTSSEITLE